MCPLHPRQLYFWPGLKEILRSKPAWVGCEHWTSFSWRPAAFIIPCLISLASRNCVCSLVIWRAPYCLVRQRCSMTVCLFPSPFSHNVMLEPASFCSFFFPPTPPLFHSTSFPSSLHPPARKGDQPAGRLCWGTRWPAYLGLHSLPVSSSQPLLSFVQLCFG